MNAENADALEADMDNIDLLHKNITGQILKGFYRVYGELGYGFSEGVYENAMAIALRDLNLNSARQMSIKVYFAGEEVGFFKADLVVNDAVVVELKAEKTLVSEHEAQLLNYLKATIYEVGLLLNFGPKPQQLRRVFSNANKGSLSWLKSAPS